MSSLKEQMHKNLYRSYFRGQRSDYTEELSLFKDIKFYTTNPLYAIFYAKKDGIISEYKLKNKVNIFNIKSNTDFYRLHRFINDNHLNIPFNALEELKNEDWSYILDGDEKREELIYIIKSLGYDGFFNYEFGGPAKLALEKVRDVPITSENPAIGVFGDKDVFIKVDDYDLRSICSLKFVKDFKDKEKLRFKQIYKIVRYTHGVKAAYNELLLTAEDYVTLTNDDIVEMLDALVKENWSKKEEMLRWYNIFKSGERPGYKEAAEKIKKELENFQE